MKKKNTPSPRPSPEGRGRKSDRPNPAAVSELMSRFYAWLYEQSMQKEKARKVFKRLRGRGFIVKA